MSNKELTILEVMEQVPEKDALLMADALLFAVYKWNPDKVKRMKLSSVIRWVGYAKKRMSWGDAFRLRSILEAKPKKVSIWTKLFKTNI
jgi:hypothetical protein